MDSTSPTHQPASPAAERPAGAFNRMSITGILGLGGATWNDTAPARLLRLVDWVFYLTYGVICIRLTLAIVEAYPNSWFVGAVQSMVAAVDVPFRRLVDDPAYPGVNRMIAPIIIAAIGCALLHSALRDVVSLLARRRGR